MLIFSLLLGVALGYLIMPAKRAYDNYDWYSNVRRLSRFNSLKLAFKDIWN